MLSICSRSQKKICKSLSESKMFCSNYSSMKTRLENGSHILRLLGVNSLTQKVSEHHFNMEYDRSGGQDFLRMSFCKFVNDIEKWNEGINLNLRWEHTQKISPFTVSTLQFSHFYSSQFWLEMAKAYCEGREVCFLVFCSEQNRKYQKPR